MNKDKKRLIITTLICLLPIVYGLKVYDALPDMVPTHWGADGEINGYSSKAFAVFGLPVFLAFLNVIVNVAVMADPKKVNHSEKMKAVVAWFIAVLSLIVVPVCLLAAQGISVNVSFIVPLIVGVIFLLVGNYLPKCKRNYTIGIKLPWTLDSDENWNRTHRLAGYVWTVGSLLFLLAALFGKGLLMLPIMILMAVIPCVYSFILYRKGI
ncbi:MAG: SdpI family protein [Alistipes sp.]|nr:SdpI family protein [Alistipes sp.]